MAVMELSEEMQRLLPSAQLVSDAMRAELTGDKVKDRMVLDVFARERLELLTGDREHFDAMLEILPGDLDEQIDILLLVIALAILLIEGE